MDCKAVRIVIEGLENLKSKAPSLPDEAVSHLTSCPACDRYYRQSRALENAIFAKIRDIRIPAAPAVSAPGPRFKRWLLTAIPLAAAAAIILLVTLVPAPDTTKALFRMAVSNTLGFEKVHADDVDSVLARFHQQTGLNAILPTEVNRDSVQTAALIEVGGQPACVMQCVQGSRTFTFFLYAADGTPWKCCCQERCHCLKGDGFQATRWKQGALGFMSIEQAGEEAGHDACGKPAE